MLPTLPNDVSLLIMGMTGPHARWARLFRVSRTWHSVLAQHVARTIRTGEFHTHLSTHLRNLNGCSGVSVAHLDAARVRDQLQEEDVGRFASLCLLLEDYEEHSKMTRRSLHVAHMYKAKVVFAKVFAKRGVLRALITWLRHARRIENLDGERPVIVARAESKRAMLERCESRLETIDEQRKHLVEKKRKLEERLGIE